MGSVAVNINFCGYLGFFSIIFVSIIWIQYATDKRSVSNWSLLHRPVLIFQPTVNCRASNKQGKLCLKQHYSLRELHSCYVSTYESGFLEGFGWWRGSILATQRNPDLHGFCSLPQHCSISDRSEQNSSKLRHTVCDIFRNC